MLKLTSPWHPCTVRNIRNAFSRIIKAYESLYDTVSVILEQAHMVELKTRGQSICKLWYEQQARRFIALQKCFVQFFQTFCVFTDTQAECTSQTGKSQKQQSQWFNDSVNSTGTTNTNTTYQIHTRHWWLCLRCKSDNVQKWELATERLLYEELNSKRKFLSQSLDC